MPELPDITLYLEQLTPRILHQPLLRVTLKSPFVLRTVEPPISTVEGKRILGLRRLGKRIVFALEGDLFLVIHLMIAGRLQWQALGSKLGSRIVLAVLEFPEGLLVLTEAGTKRRASLHLVAGEPGLQQFDRGGLEVLDAESRDLRREAHLRENTRSNGPSPTPGSSAASATPTPTRFSTAHDSRRWR